MSSATPTTAGPTTTGPTPTGPSPSGRVGGDSDRTPPALPAPRRLGRTLAAFAAGAAATALVAGGVAVAAIPTSTTGTTTLCAATSTGAARVIDTQAGQKCTARERKVSLAAGSTYRGAWAAGTTYRAGDIVMRGSAGYLARAASKGKDPALTPAAWGALAKPRTAISRTPGASRSLTPGGTVELLQLSLAPGTYHLDGWIGLRNGSINTTVLAGCAILRSQPSGNLGLDSVNVSVPFDVTGGLHGTVRVPVDEIVTVTEAKGGVRLTCSLPALSHPTSGNATLTATPLDVAVAGTDIPW